MEIKLLNHGFVRLVDSMPSIKNEDYVSFEHSIAQMARVSYGKGTKSIREDETLVQYLLEHDHTSPFEGVVLKFHLKMPIFVARQWMRHRTASINEYSARYSILSDEFYIPEISRLNKQDAYNKQMSSKECIDNSDEAIKIFEELSKSSYEAYRKLLDLGLSRELSRCVLPVSIYTEMYWVMNLHNLLRFLRLRMDSHAQYEIVVYANAICSILEKICPNLIKTWKNCQHNNLNIFDYERELLNNNSVIEDNKIVISCNSIHESIESDSSLSNRKKRGMIEKFNSLFKKVI